MNLITRFDEKKYFIVDADITKIVQLIEIKGNGWGVVKNKNGKTESLNLDRLMLYDEREKVVEIEPKVEKIVFFIKDPTTGVVTVQSLEGEEAVKWEKMMVTVCMVADKQKANPDWLKLEWKKEALPMEEKNNG